MLYGSYMRQMLIEGSFRKTFRYRVHIYSQTNYKNLSNNVSRHPEASQTEPFAIPLNGQKPSTDIPMNSTTDATGSCIYIGMMS